MNTAPRSTEKVRILTLGLVIGLTFASGSGVANAEGENSFRRWLDNEYYKIHLDSRLRMELADAKGLDESQAFTWRNRVGLGTKPIFGFSVLGELESVLPLCNSCYFNAVETPTGQTVVADPLITQLNRLFLQYDNERVVPFTASAGRQRIILDDARFVGNVGWRQNEQTYDSAHLRSSLGVDGLEVQYAYIWDVRRIFGDRDHNNLGRGDFNSDSHLVNLSYRFDKGPRVSAFGYVLDLRNKAGGSVVNSTNSFGLRVAGAQNLREDWTLDYSLAYAFQVDGEHNPTNYGTNYAFAEGLLGYKPIGKFGVGFELLGTDDGTARFVTPLATAHKFNGFADAFLDNGGVNGLQDLFITIAPKLPWGLKGKVVYHHFWSDHNSQSLGYEIDGVVKKALGHGFTVLTKAAFYDSTGLARTQGRRTIYRWVLEISYKF